MAIQAGVLNTGVRILWSLTSSWFIVPHGFVFRLHSPTDYLQINYGREHGAYVHNDQAGRCAAWFDRQDYTTIRTKRFQISGYEDGVGKWSSVIALFVSNFTGINKILANTSRSSSRYIGFKN